MSPASPFLGLGIATEHEGRFASTVVAEGLHRALPVDFLEYGGEIELGADETVRAWQVLGRPVTYHILDSNLAEAGAVDEEWLSATRILVRSMGAAWVTGDIGYWYHGRRAHENLALVPPLLDRRTLEVTIENVRLLNRELDVPYHPENPPYYVQTGQMELLRFYGELVDRADCGMVMDCTHLFQYAHASGCDVLGELRRFPLDRIVELHLSGTLELDHDGTRILDDTHHAVIREEVLRIARYLCAEGDVRAVCLELEMAQAHHLESAIEDIGAALQGTPFWTRCTAGAS